MLLTRGKSGSVSAVPNNSIDNSHIKLRVRTFDPQAEHDDASRVKFSSAHEFRAPQMLQVNSIIAVIMQLMTIPVVLHEAEEGGLRHPRRNDAGIPRQRP
jgi:hypothetical protein